MHDRDLDITIGHESRLQVVPHVKYDPCGCERTKTGRIPHERWPVTAPCTRHAIIGHALWWVRRQDWAGWGKAIVCGSVGIATVVALVIASAVCGDIASPAAQAMLGR
jgi:hypothetical protein